MWIYVPLQHVKTFLDRIPDPQNCENFDLKFNSPFLAAFRQAIIHALAKGEGHLGSSLGTVELSIALHYCFNTPKDVLIWDVGHQAYGHKMLTGRKELSINFVNWEELADFQSEKKVPMMLLEQVMQEPQFLLL